MQKKFEDFAPLLGRLLMAQIFLLSAMHKIADWSGTAGYMTAKGMPFVPFFLFMAIILELAGGLSLLTGWRTRLGALALIVFLIPTTLIFHDFWSLQGAEAHMQMIQFQKNLAILGGLFVVIGLGPGTFSLDRRR